MILAYLRQLHKCLVSLDPAHVCHKSSRFQYEYRLEFPLDPTNISFSCSDKSDNLNVWLDASFNIMLSSDIQSVLQMEKVESPLDVLSRAATMVKPCPAYPTSDSDSFETPSTASSGESEGDRTLSPEAPRILPAKEVTGKWRRERRSARLPDYKPRENGKLALRSQSFNERGGNAPLTARKLQPHSDGELSDGGDDGPTDLALNGKGAPPAYPGAAARSPEAPIDMRLRARQAPPPPPPPPPYARPTVITRSSDTPPGSMSMCDPVIDEHFRRSLGDDYMNLFKKSAENSQPGPKPNTKDRASSPILFNKTTEPQNPSKIIAMDVVDASLSVDDHFAKALGDTWKQLQSSKLNSDKNIKDNSKGVDDHFSKALGDTWNQIQCSKQNLDSKTNTDKQKKETNKTMSRSGVVI